MLRGCPFDLTKKAHAYEEEESVISRAVKGEPIPISGQVYDFDEDVVSITSGTVSFTDNSGTVTTNDPVTVAANAWSYTVPVQSMLGRFKATVTLDTGHVVDHWVDVVGSRLCSIQQIRAKIDKVTSRNQTQSFQNLTADQLRLVLAATEDLFTTEVAYSLIERRNTRRVDGEGLAVLTAPDRLINTLHSVTEDGAVMDVDDYDAGNNHIYRSSGVFPEGFRNIVVDYDHGQVVPPIEITEAAKEYAAAVAIEDHAHISSRSVSVTADTVAWNFLSNAGHMLTSLPSVNAALTNAKRKVSIA